VDEAVPPKEKAKSRKKPARKDAGTRAAGLDAAVKAAVEAAMKRASEIVAEEATAEGAEKKDSEKLPMSRATVPPGMHNPEQRVQWGLPADDDKQGHYMVEINLLYRGGLQEAREKFHALWKTVLPRNSSRPVEMSKTYFQCEMSVQEMRDLVREDEKLPDRRDRLIYRIWPDFEIKTLVYRSVSTVKADAAARSYEATGSEIVWAVIDSGIDRRHRHFGDPKDPESHALLDPDVVELHRDFTVANASPETWESALTDDYGHGTHVAGIIAGGLLETMECGKDFKVYETVFSSDPFSEKRIEKLEERTVRQASRLRGVAPNCKLISLKVLDEKGAGKSSNIIRALQYIREDLNGDPKMLRVHGVNLSVGYEFDAEMFACGQSPLCVEVDRLVKSGVVVVVAAGNTGYGQVNAQQRKTAKVGLANTINDPGNAALAITVGATHRDSPHMYGVSYFSSKGPTGDGRLKPDLVAPGERITSCAAGDKLQKHGGEIPDDLTAYIDRSGTSMAAPHVSGAIAAFLSIRREFIQRPEEVKRIFLESATSLGRERYFEGHGLLDLMRAIQSV
jgi:subtilisin family serine protease